MPCVDAEEEGKPPVKIAMVQVVADKSVGGTLPLKKLPAAPRNAFISRAVRVSS